MPENEFDVESEEGEDGDIVIRGAPPMPPEDPEPAPAPPVPPVEVKRIGRPRRERPAPPPPISAANAPPNINIAKRDDEWPKDPIGLWMHTLAWAKSQGRGRRSSSSTCTRCAGRQVRRCR